MRTELAQNPRARSARLQDRHPDRGAGRTGSTGAVLGLPALARAAEQKKERR